ncbi:squalene synthase HpnC [Acidisoma cellulosilytica]|uniref:Squalene synthase HpnC n=1 Tax=Acidisoma cellulosilyticum TaxID=2802395 RepID=A0A963Z1C3_9PROT|nr:squalene synthase HpnC [Acidisoma cellulosilyticum]MCB8880013.1 squalene synthase HpnC [Acidisoma cellulosilyticum]
MSAELSKADFENVESWSGKDKADENFPVGGLIRPDLRRHVHAYYDFARNADDIGDSPDLSAGEKIRRLDHMEDVLLGNRIGGSPSAAKLRVSLAETRVDPAHATDLLIAFRQDATKTRYATWDELYNYCRYSAMPVGRFVLAVHGESETTFPPSDALCAVLQVLNHLQDCQKDLAALDRCYLPQDLMTAYSADISDLPGRAETPGLRRVFDALLAQCDRLNAEGAALPRRVRDRRLRLETGVILKISRRLTQRLQRQDPIAGRVKVTKPDAVFALLGALGYAL